MDNMLRGIVLSKYPNITSFAEAMKWDRKKASRIINRVQKPSATDMEKMSDLLDIGDSDSFIKIFLPSVSTKWEEREARRRNPLNFYMGK